jgi:hypothetical protein
LSTTNDATGLVAYAFEAAAVRIQVASLASAGTVSQM